MTDNLLRFPDMAESYTSPARACPKCACSQRRPFRHLRRQHFVNSVVRTHVPHREGIGEQIALWTVVVDGVRRNRSALLCTVVLTVAVLLARLGSGVSDSVAAFSVITVPAGAVTFTVSRTVHVVFGAMLLFSWQTIVPFLHRAELCMCPAPACRRCGCSRRLFPPAPVSSVPREQHYRVPGSIPETYR